MKKLRFLIFLVTIFLISCTDDNSQMYISQVKDGVPFMYEEYNVTFGQAFNNFFSNPKWSYFRSDNEKDVVEFRGGCQILSVDSDVLIQFEILENGEFEAAYYEINNAATNDFIGSSLIEKAFETYFEKNTPNYTKEAEYPITKIYTVNWDDVGGAELNLTLYDETSGYIELDGSYGYYAGSYAGALEIIDDMGYSYDLENETEIELLFDNKNNQIIVHSSGNLGGSDFPGFDGIYLEK